MPELVENQLQVVVFRLDQVRFAVPLDAVQEVVPTVALTPLPSAPEVVMGIFSLRGDIVAVLDMRCRLGFPAKPLAVDQHFLVCHDGQRRIALRVDYVEELTRLDRAAIQPAERVADEVRQIAGIVQLDDGMILIHDLPQFLSSSEAVQLEAALRQWKRAEEV